MSGFGWMYDNIVGLSAPDDPALCDDAEIDRKIRLYCGSAGAAGFVMNLGGLLTLPVALPANLVSVAALQLRLVTEIAVCRGYDAHSPEVRAAAIACLAGHAALELFKNVGIQLGACVGKRERTQIAGAAAERLSRGVAARLLSRAGAQGAAGFARLVPILGGVIGGGVDAVSTKAVGEIAKRVFVRREGQPSDPALDAATPPLGIAAK